MSIRVLSLGREVGSVGRPLLSRPGEVEVPDGREVGAAAGERAFGSSVATCSPSTSSGRRSAARVEKLEDWTEQGYDWGSRINCNRITENDFGKLTSEKVHTRSEMVEMEMSVEQQAQNNIKVTVWTPMEKLRTNGWA